MANNVNINQLATAITNAVREYTEDVTAGVDNEVKATKNKVLKETKRLAAPRSTRYANGFKATDKSLPGNRRYVIWNKKDYRIVHLLEFGHAKVNGGRVRAYPHMRPAHDMYANEMHNNIRRIIRNGG